MATQVQFRRGTAAQNNVFTGAAGELTINLSNTAIRVHNGTTLGGVEMARADLTNVTGTVPAQPAGSNTNVQFNDGGVMGGSNAFTFDNTTNTVSMTNLAITGNANVGNLIPSANATYSLGNTTNRWKDLYISGNTIYMDDARISSYQQIVLLKGLSITANGSVDVANVPSTGSMYVAANVTAGNTTVNNTLTANVANVGNITGNAANFGNIVAQNITITGNVDIAALNNGNSNVKVAANSNVTVSVNGNANILTVTGTGANIAGGLSVTDNITGANLIATGAGSFGNNVNMNTNRINNLGYPSANTDAASKQYVDTLVSTGISYHQPVNVATTTTLAVATGGTTAYNSPNGAANGIGAYISTTGTFLNIDGANVQTVGTRILVKDESNAAWNGVYTYANTTAIVRSTDTDEFEIGSTTSLGINDYFFTLGGIVNEGTSFIVSAPSGTITFGTSDITFTVFSTSQVYDAGSGITISGTTISVNGSQITQVGTLTSLNVSGNANVGNIGATYFVGNGSSLESITGANVTGTVANANYAGFAGNVVNNSQPNITTVGTLTGLTSNGTVNFTGASNVSLGAVGNVKITGGSNGQFLQTNGSGTLTWATISSNSLTNGNSNVVVVANGNVNISSSGNANVAVITGTGANINGTLNVTGNVTGGNINTGGVVSATGNVTGGNINTGGVVSATGNVTGGNLVTTGRANAGTLVVSGTSNLGAVGNVTITGGSNGQVLTTNGSGGLSWTTSVSGISNIANGNSNVSIPVAGGNVLISAGGTANVVTINGIISGPNTIPAGMTIYGRLYVNNISNVRWLEVINSANIGGDSNISGNLIVTGTTFLSGNTTGSNLSVTQIVVNGNANIGYSATVAQDFIVLIGNIHTLNGNIVISNGNISVANGTISGKNLTIANGIANLGPVGNVKITGGSNGQVLTTNGSGNLSWANSAPAIASNIANGNSNVNIPTAGGNVLISSAGNANIAVITGTGANIAGTLDATGNITGGNISATGALTGFDITVTDLYVNGGIAQLGDVGNITITGGSNGQVLTTDGNGVLSWATATSGSRIAVEEVIATAGQVNFTASNTPSGNAMLWINGVSISPTAVSVASTTISYDSSNNSNYVLVAGDQVVYSYMWNSSGAFITEESIATAGQTVFTLTSNPRGGLIMSLNGILVRPSAIVNIGSTVTYVPANNGGYVLLAGDNISFSYIET